MERQREMEEQRRKREEIDNVRKVNQSLSEQIMKAKPKEEFIPHSNFD